MADFQFSEEIVERMRDILRQFHNSSCYPSAEDYEVDGAVERLTAVLSPEVGRLVEAGTELAEAACDIHPTAPSSAAIDRLQNATNGWCAALATAGQQQEDKTCA